MQLLSEDDLKWSAVVANNAMNRQRNASGINSYEKELGFKPEEFLKKHIAVHGKVKWLDLCCGEARALIQAGNFLQQEKLQEKAFLKGIDLVDTFAPIPAAITCIEFETTSLQNWKPTEKYDLITCVHGLHYIGDKLKIIKKTLLALEKEGLFIANLDLKNFVIKGQTENAIRSVIEMHGIRYNARKKILEGKVAKELDFGLIYEGADDKAGPNYTGQAAVNSHYRIK